MGRCVDVLMRVCPRTWLRSARNFAKTRFRRSPLNQFSANKKICLARFFGLGNHFTPFWARFGGSSQKRTSKSTSSQFFALDALITSSVRPKIVENMSVGIHRSRCVGASAPPFQHPTLWPRVLFQFSFTSVPAQFLKLPSHFQFSSKNFSPHPRREHTPMCKNRL